MESCESAQQAINKTYNTQEQSLEVIRRINRRAHLTMQVASQSSEQLQYQGNLLDQGQRDLDHIQGNLNRSEKKLNEINRDCCVCLIL